MDRTALVVTAYGILFGIIGSMMAVMFWCLAFAPQKARGIRAGD